MVSKKRIFFFFFFLLFLIGKNRHGIGKKGGYFRLGRGAEIRPLEKGRKSPAESPFVIIWQVFDPQIKFSTQPDTPHTMKRFLHFFFQFLCKLLGIVRIISIQVYKYTHVP